MKINRRTFLRCGLAGLAAGVASTGYATLIEPEHLSLERVNVRVPLLPAGLEGFRIGVLSDFHLHPYTTLAHIQNAIRITNTLNADLIVLLGDYVDSTVDAIHELAPAFARLNAKHGILSILGNHDHWKGSSIVMEAMSRAGIPMLKNSGIPISHGGSGLFLAGLDSAWASYPNLDEALSRRTPGTPTVLLAHEPDYADHIGPGRDIALQLSGHTHGGQVRVPFVGALRLPSWGQRYQQGLYQVGPMQLYTNRGIGLVGVPVRINCPPEITEITLVAA